MGFLISKIVWTLLAPDSLLFLLLLIAWLSHRRRPVLSRSLIGMGLLFIAALALLPLTHWCAAPLEQRFPAPGTLARVDGIIVLGGALELENTLTLQQPALNGAAERMTVFAALARQYPQARLVFTGGSGLVRNTTYKEADVARALFESIGVDQSRMVYENASRNTWENALYSKKLVDPKPGETWLLVTSAWHMPRSVGCFRKAGWEVVPYPVDYIGNDSHWAGFNSSRQLADLGLVEKELLGLLSYHLLNRTDALFPAPRPPQ